ncbi:MAG TPA: BON domain-containing protein, partial [Nannocystis sp.]
RGRYTGRGPRNYRRSDERITDDIHEMLTYSPQIDASDIEVRVDDGEVTVLGTVDNRYTRRLVEDLIHDIPGVRDLHNRLRVTGEARVGAIGRAHSGIEPLRIRRDITAGRDLDDAESADSHLNVGDDRPEERGTSSMPH